MAAAYKVVPGVAADEAEAQGLVVVEYAIAGASSVPIYGYYLDADAPGIAPTKRKGKGEATGDAAPEAPEADAATGG